MPHADTQRVHAIYQHSHDIMFRELATPSLHKSTRAPGPVVSLSKAQAVG
jgi:hypothetical protein